jgi:hypothetical protein
MSHTWTVAAGHAYHAQRYHSINEFSKPFLINKKALYIEGDPFPDQISYCYAHGIMSYHAY